MNTQNKTHRYQQKIGGYQRGRRVGGKMKLVKRVIDENQTLVMKTLQCT